jgi:phage terminase small subunit
MEEQVDTKSQFRARERNKSHKSPSDRRYASDVPLVHATGDVEQPPAHLSPDTQATWRKIVAEASFVFEAHHRAMLWIFCAALERATQARRDIDQAGQMIASRYGLAVNPLIAVERESQRTALRALAALKLDAPVPDASPRRPGPRGAGH